MIYTHELVPQIKLSTQEMPTLFIYLATTLLCLSGLSFAASGRVPMIPTTPSRAAEATSPVLLHCVTTVLKHIATG